MVSNLVPPRFGPFMVSKRRRGFPRVRDGYVEYMRGLWLIKEGYRASKEGYSAVKRGTSGRV